MRTPQTETGEGGGDVGKATWQRAWYWAGGGQLCASVPNTCKETAELTMGWERLKY